MNTTTQKTEIKKEVKCVAQNVIANIAFKHSLLGTDTTINKNIIFLKAKSSKQIFYRICDYMYSNGYTGFEIKDLKILEEGMTVDMDLIISIPDGKLMTFDKK